MASNKNQRRIQEMQQRMARVERLSSRMCTAKWLQSTIYLHNGQTHSCHHPPSHAIDAGLVALDPAALHNTVVKEKARRELLSGKQTAECSYCWNIENLGTERFSDRTYKSTDERWSFPFLEEVEAAGAQGKVLPRYLEVSFSSTCNFKCAYCSPDTSSSWMEEVKRFGPYPTSRSSGDLGWIRESGRMPISEAQLNPYLEAFWRWWPELLPNLRVFRVTGGEPLLSPHTWRCIDGLISQPNQKLDFAINSNMNVPLKLMDRLFALSEPIQRSVRSFEVYTSCEAFGAQAEYIRHGMNHEMFLRNIEAFLETSPATVRLNFMITFNLLSVSSFVPFLKSILALRVKYNHTPAFNRIPFMISYLRWPEYLSMRILPRKIREHYAEEFRAFAETAAVKFFETDGTNGLYLEEKDQLLRLCDFMLQDFPEAEEKRNRIDFGRFIMEHDRRRDRNFCATFPELIEFLETCLQLDEGELHE